ncbi:ribose import ATP-binding protein RbsA [Spirochaetia bacterium]|nr:ribose import ATP-binding protein RbsA [Spirochaetia bacterium]GHV80521.1 ribose import ATP-binding protein RbsA [Spirochaetia bacterium]
MADIICSIDKVSKIFPGVKALNEVSFDVLQGEIHALVGENGAGKSTLMNILSGEFPASSGTIVFCGAKVHFTIPRQAQHAGIAMIHQELSLSPALSIAENIFQGQLPKNSLGFVDYKKMFKDARRYMEEVGLHALNEETLIRNINVSQQQQVEIAKALVRNAKLLILDEPTSALTTTEAEKLMGIMRDLKSRGITMLYISHKLGEIMEISDRVTVLRDGCFIQTLNTKETNVTQLISLMVGRDYNKADMRSRFKTDYTNAEPVLEVANLTVNRKIKNVNFKLYRGEVLGLTGLVGAGRSEVLQAVFGADRHDSLEIKVNGKKCMVKNCTGAIRQGIGLVAEGRKQQGLFLKQSVAENMSLVNLWNMKNWLRLISPARENRIVGEYINKLQVKTPGADQIISNLSGGNQQKAIIARWLMNNPEILFLDEPTQGIDVGVKKDIYDIIDTLVSQGVSILFVSSDMQEILSLCDRIIVMYEGEITGELLHGEATQDKIMTLASNQ